MSTHIRDFVQPVVEADNGAVTGESEHKKSSLPTNTHNKSQYIPENNALWSGHPLKKQKCQKMHKFRVDQVSINNNTVPGELSINQEPCLPHTHNSAYVSSTIIRGSH